MKNNYLYAGKILWVDLTREKVWTTPTADYAKSFLGGKGIGVRILWETSGLRSVDALGPDNALSFDSGPLTGTMMPSSGRCYVHSKSPLTGLLGVTSFGGSFAPELKYAGYDNVVITGQAKEPVYLAIENEAVTIRPAAKIWGMDAHETSKVLHKELKDEEIRWACIGPAGEKLIRFATIIGSTGDSTGPTGLGAVMGSKKLKAVAVRGMGGLQVASPERFYDACARTHDALKANNLYKEITRRPPPGGTDKPTHSGFAQMNDIQALNQDWGDEAISSKLFRRDERFQKTGCFACPTRCMDDYHTRTTQGGIVFYSWYAEIAAKIGVRDLMTWRKLLQCAHKHGYDTVSLVEMTAWATDLWQQGIIDEKDVGFPLAWGDGEAYLKLAEMIARREGFGDILAEGLTRAALTIGRGSERYAGPMLGWPHPEQKSVTGVGSQTAVVVGEGNIDAQPIAEERSVHYYGHFAEGIAGTRLAFPTDCAGKAETIVRVEDAMGRANILGTCKWHTELNALPITADVHAEILSIGLGEKVTVDELSVVQRRVRQLERAFNCRQGLRRQHDTLPDQSFADSSPNGNFEGTAIDRGTFEETKDRYYELRGWDLATGVPTRATLESLGLKDVADELDRQGVL
jgi:aldehyde:ferredoxin oxidoreductase